MELDLRKLLAAGAIVGVLGLGGGAAVAGAQESTDDSTTTTEQPAADSGDDTADDESTERDGEGCDKDEATDDATASSSS
jgi:hypothetical protein